MSGFSRCPWLWADSLWPPSWACCWLCPTLGSSPLIQLTPPHDIGHQFPINLSIHSFAITSLTCHSLCTEPRAGCYPCCQQALPSRRQMRWHPFSPSEPLESAFVSRAASSFQLPSPLSWTLHWPPCQPRHAHACSTHTPQSTLQILNSVIFPNTTLIPLFSEHSPRQGGALRLGLRGPWAGRDAHRPSGWVPTEPYKALLCSPLRPCTLTAARPSAPAGPGPIRSHRYLGRAGWVLAPGRSSVVTEWGEEGREW